MTAGKSLWYSQKRILWGATIAHAVPHCSLAANIDWCATAVLLQRFLISYQNSTRNINWSLRGLLDPVILPNVAGVEMLAGGAFRIA